LFSKYSIIAPIPAKLLVNSNSNKIVQKYQPSFPYWMPVDAVRGSSLGPAHSTYVTVVNNKSQKEGLSTYPSVISFKPSYRRCSLALECCGDFLNSLNTGQGSRKLLLLYFYIFSQVIHKI